MQGGSEIWGSRAWEEAEGIWRLADETQRQREGIVLGPGERLDDECGEIVAMLRLMATGNLVRIQRYEGGEYKEKGLDWDVRKEIISCCDQCLESWMGDRAWKVKRELGIA